MRKIYLFSIFLLFSLFWAGFVMSQESPKDVSFPVAELASCASEEECKTYCDKPENASACLDFAKVHNLMSEEEIKTARDMLEIMEGAEGPGGCRNQTECDVYCNNPDHMEECIVFGKEHGLIPAEELKEAEAVLEAIKKGVKPPPCQGEAECDIYCSEPEHMGECLAFGEAAGFITPEEAAMIRRTGGKGPGGCQGKTECDTYCQSPDNMEECLSFALEYELMSPEEAKEAKMMLEAIKKGVKMPTCQGKEECDIYCSEPEHMGECLAFGEAAGFITPEEAAMIRRTGGKSPGGCQSEKECDIYCENPDNMKECLEFAVKTGMMTREEAERAKKMADMGTIGGPGGCQSQEGCDVYCQDPAHRDECLNFAVDAGFMSPEEAEKARKMTELETAGGPGGCQNQKECEVYCSTPEHAEECFKFSVEQEIITPEEAAEMKERTIKLLPEGLPKKPSGEIIPSPSSGGEMKPSEKLPEKSSEQIIPPPDGNGMEPSEELPKKAPGEIILPPPDKEAPQSFLDFIKYFLAGLIPILE